MNKKILSTVLMAAAAMGSYAQSGTNSPYSQYGIGILADQSTGFSRGMNGASLGMRQGNVVNPTNPASYSAADSLTMIFDVGMTGQITNFKEGQTKVNAKNANFDYAVGLFRLFPGVGVSFGVLPYSNVGYKYTTSTYLDRTNGTITETYTGEGGLHEVFLGAGMRITPQLSIGFNAAYLWGTIDRWAVSSSTTYINSLSKSYSTSVNSYKADLGLQYTRRLTKNDELTVGATIGIGHKLHADAECNIINNNTTGTSDTTTIVAANALELPMSYGAGVTWRHNNSLLVCADIGFQQWSKVSHPRYDSATNTYEARTNVLRDRWTVAAGADFVPESQSRNYLKRVHYRLGGGFATPYYNINNSKGPNELSLSAGFGLPLQNAYNSRSVLNISAQWVRTSAKDMITENSFRLNIGLTFNERWFFKWKID